MDAKSKAEFINSVNATKVTIMSITSSKTKTGECITKFKLQVANLHDLNIDKNNYITLMNDNLENIRIELYK